MPPKKDPFGEDEGEEKPSTETAQERLADRVEKAQTKPERDEPVEVDLDKVDEEIDESTVPERQQLSRRQKRQERFSTLVERQRMAEERAEAAERREREQRELFMAQLQRMQQPQQQKPEEDPLEAEWARVTQEQDLAYREFRSRQNVTPEEEAAFAQKAREFQRRMVTIGGKFAMRESGGGQPTADQIRSAVTAERMRTDYGDVMGDQRKMLYFDGAWKQLVARGKPDDWSTMDEAAEATRRAFGMKTKRPASAPSDSYKRKLSGVSRGGGVGGTEDRQVVTLTKERQKMANAMYSHIKDPAERQRRWAAGPGRRLLEKDKAG